MASARPRRPLDRHAPRGAQPRATREAHAGPVLLVQMHCGCLGKRVPAPAPAPVTELKVVIAIHDFDPQGEHELGLKKGDRLIVVDDSEEWYIGYKEGHPEKKGCGPALV